MSTCPLEAVSALFRCCFPLQFSFSSLNWLNYSIQSTFIIYETIFCPAKVEKTKAPLTCSKCAEKWLEEGQMRKWRLKHVFAGNIVLVHCFSARTINLWLMVFTYPPPPYPSFMGCARLEFTKNLCTRLTSLRLFVCFGGIWTRNLLCEGCALQYICAPPRSRLQSTSQVGPLLWKSEV